MFIRVSVDGLAFTGKEVVFNVFHGAIFVGGEPFKNRQVCILDHRRGNANQYCRSNLEAQVDSPGLHALRCEAMFDKIDACKDMNKLGELYPCRYRKLNVQSYFRHRTLEVRHHSGTVEPTKITNWIRLMGRMFDAAENFSCIRNRSAQSGFGKDRMAVFFRTINATYLSKFYTDRAKKLAA
jgi:hypothetical protein